MVTKKRARTMLNQSFTCQNPSCGKVFPKPIKASDLRLKKVEVYDACPHCLAKVVLEEIPLTDEREIELKVDDVRIGEKRLHSIPATEDETAKHSPEMRCLHQFGYLSQRSKKENIPEECMVCERIVKCMLKNVTG